MDYEIGIAGFGDESALKANPFKRDVNLLPWRKIMLGRLKPWRTLLLTDLTRNKEIRILNIDTL